MIVVVADFVLCGRLGLRLCGLRLFSFLARRALGIGRFAGAPFSDPPASFGFR